MQNEPSDKFCEKPVLKNFAISTGKHLCWGPFLLQHIAKYYRAPILKNKLLKKFMKLKNIKNC